MTTQPKLIRIAGGLDLVLPPLERPGGLLQAVQNYRNSQEAGIERIKGFERFDGKAGPSEVEYWVVPFDNGQKEFIVGMRVIGETSGTTGEVLDYEVTSGAWSTCDAAGNLFLMSISGTFQDDENINPDTGEGFSNGFSSGFEVELPGFVCSSILASSGRVSTIRLIRIYDYLNDLHITNITIGTASGDVADSLDFSPDQSVLAGGFPGTPYLRLIDSSTWSLMSSPSTMPTARSVVAFNPAGTILACAYTDNLLLYDPSDWSTISGPGVLYTGIPLDVTFSRDGSLLAIAISASPYIVLYNTSTWTKLSNPSTLPAGQANRVSFDDDDSHLAVSHVNSPYFTIYETSGWTKIADPASLPDDDCFGCKFSKDGAYLAIGKTSALGQQLYIYDTSDWSLVSGTADFANVIYDFDWSSDDAYLGVAELSQLEMLDTSDWSDTEVSPQSTGNCEAVAFN